MLALHRACREKYRLPFPLLSDPEKGVMRAYGAYGKKTMYDKTERHHLAVLRQRYGDRARGS